MTVELVRYAIAHRRAEGFETPARGRGRARHARRRGHDRTRKNQARPGRTRASAPPRRLRAFRARPEKSLTPPTLLA